MNDALLRRIPRFAAADSATIAALAARLFPLIFLPGEMMIRGALPAAEQRAEGEGGSGRLLCVQHEAWLLVRGLVNELGAADAPQPTQPLAGGPRADGVPLAAAQEGGGARRRSTFGCALGSIRELSLSRVQALLATTLSGGSSRRGTGTTSRSATTARGGPDSPLSRR